MKTILIGALSIISSQTFAQNSKPITEAMIFIPNDCKVIGIDMANGQMRVENGEPVPTVCKPTGNSFGCLTVDSKGIKIHQTDEMSGNIQNAEGIISDNLNSFIFNVASRHYYSTGSFMLYEGKFRGEKICSGAWMYYKELEEYQKQNQEEKPNKT